MKVKAVALAFPLVNIPFGLSLIGALGWLLAISWLPIIIGWNKQDRWKIFWLTVLLGWTGFGWVAALVWAFRAPRRTPVDDAPLSLQTAPASPQIIYPHEAHAPFLQPWLVALFVAGTLLGGMYLATTYFQEPSPTTSRPHAEKKKVGHRPK